MKKLLSTLGLICVFAFSVTLFGERQKRYPPAISSATMDAVCKQIRPENFERQFREVLGEPRNVRALTGHSGEGRGGYEWECEFTGQLYTSEWDFPHDETIPAFSLMTSNKSTGPNANVLQIVDRGGSYNELAIDLLTELCEANGWKYHVHWAPRREERMGVNRRRATMRKQYFATQEILDQLQSADWYRNVDPEWRTLQLVPGKGDSFRPDTWGYEVSRNVYRYGETGRIKDSKATGYHLRVEGGLSRDGVARLRVLNFRRNSMVTCWKILLRSTTRRAGNTKYLISSERPEISFGAYFSCWFLICGGDRISDTPYPAFRTLSRVSPFPPHDFHLRRNDPAGRRFLHNED